jgi:hypothetical protein
MGLSREACQAARRQTRPVTLITDKLTDREIDVFVYLSGARVMRISPRVRIVIMSAPFWPSWE